MKNFTDQSDILKKNEQMQSLLCENSISIVIHAKDNDYNAILLLKFL